MLALHEAGHAVAAGAIGYADVRATVDDVGGVTEGRQPVLDNPTAEAYASLIYSAAGPTAQLIPGTMPPTWRECEQQASAILDNAPIALAHTHAHETIRPDEQEITRAATNAAYARGYTRDQDATVYALLLIAEAVRDAHSLLRCNWPYVVAATAQLLAGGETRVLAHQVQNHRSPR
jgi:hypothetical protein